MVAHSPRPTLAALSWFTVTITDPVSCHLWFAHRYASDPQLSPLVRPSVCYWAPAATFGSPIGMLLGLHRHSIQLVLTRRSGLVSSRSGRLMGRRLRVVGAMLNTGLRRPLEPIEWPVSCHLWFAHRYALIDEFPVVTFGPPVGMLLVAFTAGRGGRRLGELRGGVHRRSGLA